VKFRVNSWIVPYYDEAKALALKIGRYREAGLLTTFGLHFKLESTLYHFSFFICHRFRLLAIAVFLQ